MKISHYFLSLTLCILSFSCNGQYIFQDSNTGSSSSTTSSTNTTTSASEFETQMLKAVNNWRKKGCKCGSKRMPATKTVSWNDELTQASKKHAADLVRRQTLDHRGADGSTIGQRAQAAGYEWMAIAENIAEGYTSIEGVVQGWITSPGHCKNMMSENYTEIGVYRKDNYWVMMLGNR